MVQTNSDVIFNIVEFPDIDEVLHIVEEKNLDTVLVPSIETLKCNNKKCGIEEVFRLVQESVVSEFTKEILKSC